MISREREKKMKECCRKYLAEQFGDDEEIMGEIYGEYVQSVKEKIAELKEALGAADWQRSDRIAHTIKGNALAAGDEEVARLAIEIRKTAALGDGERSLSLLAEMEKQCESL